jgi:hypothetical protein
VPDARTSPSALSGTPGTDEEEPESQVWTPTGPANAVRVALRHPTHGEPDARAFHRGPRMRCGWGCGTDVPGANARTSPYAPKRPAASEHADRRARSLKVKRGLPPRRRMLFDWRFGTESRRAGCGHIGLLRPAYRSQYTRALHQMPTTTGRFRPRGPTRGEPASHAGPPTGAANAMRPALPHQTTASQSARISPGSNAH